jgi:hypothetical protein
MEIEDLAEIEVLMHVESGEIEPLAKHIEKGGGLGPDLRRWLADHLRGKNHPKKQGVKRLWSQIQLEMRVADHVRYIQNEQWLYDAVEKFGVEYCKEQFADNDKYARFVAENRKPITEYRAVKLYLEAHPKMNLDTLRTYLRKAKAERRRRGW